MVFLFQYQEFGIDIAHRTKFKDYSQVEKSPSLRYKKDIVMRILFLILMMSFFSQGAFACVKLPGFADPEDYKPAQEEKLKVLPNPTEETLKIDQDEYRLPRLFHTTAKQAYINSEIIDADRSLENKYKYSKFDEYSNHIISESDYEFIDFKNQVENIKEVLIYLEEIYKDSVKHQKFNKDQLCGIQLINPDGCLLGFIDDVLTIKTATVFWIVNKTIKQILNCAYYMS